MPAQAAAVQQAPDRAELKALRAARQQRVSGIREHYQVMNLARLSSALTTGTPFAERLVHFWANHFAISADRLPILGLAGLLEFEGIRPHLLGRFSDMLIAVEQHPAMLATSTRRSRSAPNPRSASSHNGAAGGAASTRISRAKSSSSTRWA